MLYIVNSEKEYFDLIYDFHMYGEHYPNVYSDMDKQGLSVISDFNKLPLDIIETYLGISDFENKLSTTVENGVMYEEETFRPDKPLSRDDMRYIPEFVKYIDFPPPKEEDFPIIISWLYGESFDRGGKALAAAFEWKSLKKSSSHLFGKTRIKRTRELWEKDIVRPMMNL